MIDLDDINKLIAYIFLIMSIIIAFVFILKYEDFRASIEEDVITFIEYKNIDEIKVIDDYYILYKVNKDNSKEMIKIPTENTKIYNVLPKDKIPYLREVKSNKKFKMSHYEIYLYE